jgi:predicted transposase YbfD/YdcC
MHPNGEHGKIEIRRYWTTSDIGWLQGKENWKNLKTICMVERERDFGEKIEKEKSYYIGSVGSDAQIFGSAVRSHWGIENSLHWVLDVSFREDESRIRKGKAPENFAVLRHIALNMIKKEKIFKKEHQIQAA